MCLMYVEPLDQKAALQCVGDNFMYFGEPMACCSFGFINAVLATVLGHFTFLIEAGVDQLYQLDAFNAANASMHSSATADARDEDFAIVVRGAGRMGC